MFLEWSLFIAIDRGSPSLQMILWTFRFSRRSEFQMNIPVPQKSGSSNLVSTCIKWITLKKKSFYQSIFTEISQIVINIFYGAQERTFSSNIRGKVKKIVPSWFNIKPQLQTGLKNPENYAWISAAISDLDQAALLW